MQDRPRIIELAIDRIIQGHLEYRGDLQQISDTQLETEILEEQVDAYIYQAERAARINDREATL